MKERNNTDIVNTLLTQKEKIAFLPTPIEKLVNLTKDLKGANVYIKRDDQTGLAFGGNKTRKIEYLIYDALQRKCDSVICVGAYQSNSCRQTAAACTKYGLDCHLLLVGDKKEEFIMEGNILLDEILGAQFHHVEDDTKIMEEYLKLKEDLISKGKNPAFFPAGGSNEVGILGYINAYLEILEQEKEMGVKFDYLVFASASYATQVGLIIGNKLFGNSEKIIYGIPVSKSFLDTEAKVSPDEKIINLLNDFDKKFKTNIVKDYNIKDKDIILDHRFNDSGYGIISKMDYEAIIKFSRKEAIILDPVYSGRSGAGLIHLVSNNEIPKDKNVLYILTGGGPALFTPAYKSFN